MLDPKSRQFILENYKRLSLRQIARHLGVSRSEVEKFVAGLSPGPVETAEKTEAVSGKREMALLACIFLSGFILRLFYVHAIGATPFFEPLSKTLDDGVYDLMAQEMSRGNWMADLPYSAYRVPLYPYFLAVLYQLFGRSIALVHYLQSFLGVCSSVMLYFLARTVFGSVRVAALAGFLSAIYLPFIFFENMLVGESLSLFLNIAALLCLVHAVKNYRKALAGLLSAGFLLGLSVLLRPNTLLPVIFLAIYLCVAFRRSGKTIFAALILSVFFLFSSMVPLVPITLRNYKLHRDFLPISAVGGVNFYIGNNPEANGKFDLVGGIGTSLDEMLQNSQKIAEKERNKPLKPSQIASYWTEKGIRYLLSSPADALSLFLLKTAYFFNHYEFPDILDIRFVAQFIPFLRWNLVGYGGVVLLGMVGMWMAFRKRVGPALVPGLFFLGYGLSVILFFITARYRLPAVPALILFSAYGLDGLISAWRSGRRPELFKFTAAVCVLSAVVFWPVGKVDFATNYNSLGISLKKKGDHRQAEVYYRKAIEIAPEYPSPYYNLALLLDQTDRRDEAAFMYQKHDSLKRTEAASAHR